MACCVITNTQAQFLPSGARCESSSATGERPRCAIEHECCGAATLPDSKDPSKSYTIDVCHDKQEDIKDDGTQGKRTYPYYSA
jgi:hypothetical protein